MSLPTVRPKWLRLLTITVLCAMFFAYAFIWASGLADPSTAFSISYFFLIGIFGATIANSTGTGGGVVFVPAFSIVEEAGGIPLTTSQIVAMSFIIQSFGMTIGSLTWVNRLYKEGHAFLGISIKDFWRVVALVVATCLPSLWTTQLFVKLDPGNLLIIFKSFSIVLGMTLLLSVIIKGKNKEPKTQVEKMDWIALAAMGMAGGLATGLLSVGVGEFVALYLFIRGFSLRASVASAVVISAATVIAGVPGSILLQNITWEIIAMAAPGVVIGGFLGRRVAQALGATKLKVLASVWIIGSATFLIARALGWKL